MRKLSACVRHGTKFSARPTAQTPAWQLARTLPNYVCDILALSFALKPPSPYTGAPQSPMTY